MTLSSIVEWHQLHHAYGVASDIPDLLLQIQRFPSEANWEDEPWFSLWSALYHQGDIYSASIAAVPAIVSALAASPSSATLSFFLLPTSIAIADHSAPAGVSSSLRADFMASLQSLGTLARAAIPSLSDPYVANAAAAALLVAQGEYQRAEELLEAAA